MQKVTEWTTMGLVSGDNESATNIMQFISGLGNHTYKCRLE